MRVYHRNIPTYNNDTDTWSTTTFSNQEEFANFLKENYRECGEYGFDEVSLKFNEKARHFEKHKTYTTAPKGTKERRVFWDTEKKKCRIGVIYLSKGKKFFITPDYYLLLNYLKIPSNKEKNQDDSFASFRDVQYQMCYYEHMAAAFHKHAATVKRRQCMSSTTKMAKFIGILWFERSKRLKLLGYKDDYITGTHGSWKILEFFRDSLNAFTDWKREFLPAEVGEWEQKVKIKRGNKTTFKGRRSSIIGKTLNKDPKSGIGGPTFIAFYEEGGVAPTMKETFQFIVPAMESGTTLVGQFIAAGTVGDLIQCKPLEDMIKKPDAYNVLAVPTKNYDSTGVTKMCGLFIGAQFGMPEFVDEFGNSMVKEALAYITELDIKKKASLSAVEYNQWKSQNPTTIEEAFQYREDLYFPKDIIQRQQDKITMGTYPDKFFGEKGMMIEEHGVPKFIPLDKMPNPKPYDLQFPVDPQEEDKRGLVTIYEHPPKDNKFFIHFAGVDSIKSNVTNTSNSLFCVYIIRRAVRKIIYDEEGNKTEKYEPKKIMASYVGRFPDAEDTNKVGELLIRYYNAFAACERNEPNFINHMRRNNFETLIMKRKDLPLFKDVDATGLSNDEFGVYFGSDSVAEGLMNAKIKEELRFVYDAVYKKDSEGNLTNETYSKTRGVDYIPDFYLLQELKLWYHGLNTDRRVGYGLALMACDSYEMSYTVTTEENKPKVNKNRNPNVNLLGRSTSHKKNKSLI